MKTLSPKHRPKIAKSYGHNSNGYHHDNAEVAFDCRPEKVKQREMLNEKRALKNKNKVVVCPVFGKVILQRNP